MSDKNRSAGEATEVVAQAKGIWARHSRQIITAAIAAVVLIGGYLAYLNLYQLPNEEKASEEIFQAEMDFRRDSLSLALNGNGKTPGFLKVISKYGSTPTGNIARLYAGECYLHLGDFKNAAKQLEDFSDHGAHQLGAKAAGLLGDAYSELKENDKAVTQYRKAASLFEDDPALSSEYLFRAGLLLELSGKSDEAANAYQELWKKFPRTEKGFLAEKYLARLGAKVD
jgi:tetratricopeptide (TPR) repeat protein